MSDGIQMHILDFISNERFNPLKAYALRGNGFENGKNRIKEFFCQNSAKDDRINFLKKEYGFGGYGSLAKKPGYIYGISHTTSSHKIDYYNEKCEKCEMKVTYEELANEIDKLIRSGEYE